MIPLKEAARSSIVKKLITSVTGLLLVGFVVTHLLGNLTLLNTHAEPFNNYSYKLASFGWLLTVAEVGLAFLFLAHIFNGYRLKKDHLEARGTRYKIWKSKGAPSKANASSLYMAVSGTLILIFLIIHIIQFRFGPGVKEGYTVDLQGVRGRDLHRLVLEHFSQPTTVAFYVISVLFLGMHLRHGIWSAFQSLGWINHRNSAPISRVSTALALLFALGFAVIPVWIYFNFTMNAGGALQ